MTKMRKIVELHEVKVNELFLLPKNELFWLTNGPKVYIIITFFLFKIKQHGWCRWKAEDF